MIDMSATVKDQTKCTSDLPKGGQTLKLRRYKFTHWPDDRYVCNCWGPNKCISWPSLRRTDSWTKTTEGHTHWPDDRHVCKCWGPNKCISWPSLRRTDSWTKTTEGHTHWPGDRYVWNCWGPTKCTSWPSLRMTDSWTKTTEGHPHWPDDRHVCKCWGPGLGWRRSTRCRWLSLPAAAGRWDSRQYHWAKQNYLNNYPFTTTSVVEPEPEP